MQENKTTPLASPIALSDNSLEALFEQTGSVSDSTDDLRRTIRPRELSAQQRKTLEQTWAGEAAQGDQIRKSIKSGDTLAASDVGRIAQLRILVRATEEHDRSDYQLLDAIAEGGIGVVYAARQVSIDRTVALKMLQQQHSRDSVQRRKFISEAVVTGELDHPNIVPVYDLASTEDGALFYSMKRVQGTPWSQTMAGNSLEENLAILMKVADAVAFAHSRGVVHRDLKPENVMLGGFGEVLVMDWGIALKTDEHRPSEAVVGSTGLGGTPAYMAPEMATGPVEAIGPASDVYLLGGMLYEMITGLTPHIGRDVMECVKAAARNEIQAADQSGELLNIALKAMATDPGDRFETVQEFQAAIRAYQSHSESIALSSRAADDLSKAELTRDYQDFARALFAYEEALALWDENTRARRGVAAARQAYAQCAFEKGDYDLGLSLLDPASPQHLKLHGQLESAQQDRDARQQRLRAAKATIALAVLALFTVGVVSFVQVTRAKEAAEANELAAWEAQRGEEQKAQQAIEARRHAETALRRAQAAREREQYVKRLTEYETYLTQIGLASERIDNNAFDDARRLLQQYADPRVSHLRHWEWGRLWHLCQLAAADFSTPSAVEAVAFSPDGRQFVAAGRDGRARIWRTAFRSARWDGLLNPSEGRSRSARTDSEIRATPAATIKHASGVPIRAVEYSPDGRFIATAGDDGLVRLWNAHDLRGPPAVFNGHTAPVLDVTFSYALGRRWLLSCSQDKSVIVRDVPSGEIIHTLRRHSWWVWSVAASADGRWIATAGQDAKIILLELNEGQGSGVTSQGSGVRSRGSDSQLSSLNSQPAHHSPLTTHHSPERSRWPGIRNEKVLVDYHGGPVFAVAFSPDSRRVASGGINGRVVVFDPEKARSVDLEKRLRGEPAGDPPGLVLQGHTAPVRSVTFSPDENGSQVLSGSDDNTMIVWDATAGRAVHTLRGHGSWVRSCAFAPRGLVVDPASPSDRAVLSGSYDHTARLWRIAGYEEVRVLRSRTFKGHDDAVLDAAFDRAGKLVVTAGKDRTARIWDLGTGEYQELRDAVFQEGHDYLASKAVFFQRGARRGRFFLTASMDNTVRIWELASGAEVARLTGTGTGAAVALSPDERWIVTGSSDNRVLLWETDKVLAARSRRLVARRADKSATTNDPEGGRDHYVPYGLIGHSSKARVTAVGFSPDGRRLISGDSLGTCIVWNMDRAHPETQRTTDNEQNQSSIVNRQSSIQVLQRRSVHSRRVNTVFFLADARRVVSSSNDYTVALWDVETGGDLARFVHPDSVISMDLAPDGRRAVTVCRAAAGKQQAAGSRSRMEDRGSRRRPLTTHHSPLTPIPTPDSLLRVIDLDDQRVGQEKIIADTLISSAAFAPDGASVLTAANDNVVRRWDLQSGRHDALWNDSARRGLIWSCVFTPDQTRVLTVGGRVARLWNLADGAPQMDFGPHAEVFSARFSPDGTRLVTAGQGRSIKIWDVARSRVERRLVDVHYGLIVSAVFSPVDSDVLLTAGGSSARLWRRDVGRPSKAGPTASEGRRTEVDGEWEPTAELRGHSRPLRSAAFSNDGRRVVTASDDGTARIWQAESGRLLAVLGGRHGHQAPVSCAVFSPDGKWVVTGSEDRTARIWARDSAIINSHDSLLAGTVPRLASPMVDWQFVVHVQADSRSPGLESWRPIAVLEGHPAPVNAVAVSRDRFRVLTGGDDKTARLWDTRMLADARFAGTEPSLAVLVQKILDAAEAIRSQVEKPSIRDQIGSDQLWEEEIRAAIQRVHTLIEPDQPLEAGDWAAEIQALTSLLHASLDDAVASGDDDPRLGDATRLERLEAAVVQLKRIAVGPDAVDEILSLRGHAGEVTSVAFSPDGRSALTGSRDGTAVLWPAANLPPVVQIPRDPLEAPPGSPFVHVAPHGVVRDPDSPDFTGGALVVELSGVSGPSSGAHLQIEPGGEGGGRRWEVSTGQSELTVIRNGQPVVIGVFRFSEDGTRLEAELNEHADAAALTELLSHISVELPAAGGGTELEVRIELTDGDGNRSAPARRTVRAGAKASAGGREN